MTYVHASIKKIKKIKNKKQTSDLKPMGLWYAKNDIWINWSKKHTNIDYKYFYSLVINHTNLQNPDKTKILLIKTMKDLTNFTIKYGYKHIDKMSNVILIKWSLVEKDFGGVEIKNIKHVIIINNKLKKHFELDDEITIFWNYMFDIDSGCVWNSNSIKQFNEITF